MSPYGDRLCQKHRSKIILTLYDHGHVPNTLTDRLQTIFRAIESILAIFGVLVDFRAVLTHCGRLLLYIISHGAQRALLWTLAAKFEFSAP